MNGSPRSRIRRKRVLIPLATIPGLVVATKRVIGVPGDAVVGRNERVFVNGTKADDIPTDPFPETHLGPKQYFVLGDNRSESQDSRAFGPVPRNTTFGRVILIYWPLGRFGTPGYNKKLVPPGPADC